MMREYSFAILCRPVFYEDMCAPLRIKSEDIIINVSPPLSDSASILQYLKDHRVQGIIIENNLPQVAEFQKFPLPTLVYKKSSYHIDISDWLEALNIRFSSVKPANQERPQKPELEKKVIQTKKVEQIPTKKLIVYSSNEDIITILKSDPTYEIVHLRSDFTAFPDDQSLEMVDCLFLEESVFANQELTSRELNLNHVISLCRNKVKLSLLLFNNHGVEFINNLIDNDFYNFLAEIELDSESIIELISTDKKLSDVEHYYNDIKERQMATEHLNNSNYEFSKSIDPDPGINEEIKEMPDTEEKASINLVKNEIIVASIDEEDSNIMIAGKENKRKLLRGSIDVSRISTRIMGLQQFLKRKQHGSDAVEQNKEIEEEYLETKFVEEDPTIEIETADSIVKEKVPNNFHLSAPHRILIYSPKGGSGATTLSLEILKMYRKDSAGLVELAYGYSQLTNKLNLMPNYNLLNLVEGLEEYAICEDNYLCSPAIFPLQSVFNHTMLNDWLNKASRAFSEKTIIADLQSASAPILVTTALKWCTRSIWIVEDTEDGYGMTDLQLMHLKRMSSDCEKVSIIVQSVFHKSSKPKKLPWEELEVPILGRLPIDKDSKEWLEKMQVLVASKVSVGAVS